MLVTINTRHQTKASRYSDIIGFDNEVKRKIPMTPRTTNSQPIISINKKGLLTIITNSAFLVRYHFL